jgi:hypothetical protein
MGASMGTNVVASVLCVLGIVGCSISPDSDKAADYENIVGGRAIADKGAVGALVTADGRVATGLLVSSTLVLTAAHVADGMRKGGRFYYGTAPSVGAEYSELASVGVRTTPYLHPDARPTSRDSDDIDIGAVVLERPIEGVTRIPIVDEDLTRWLGLSSPYKNRNCMILGFGSSKYPSGGVQARREAVSRILDVDSEQITTGWPQDIDAAGIGIGGDSGSPLICDGYVIGIMSGGLAPSLFTIEDLQGVYERLDLASTRMFLARVLDENP